LAETQTDKLEEFDNAACLFEALDKITEDAAD
jgi:hypothetical protein